MRRISYSQKFKHELYEKFDKKCAYCSTELYEPMSAVIEHFAPKSKYPHLMEDPDNLLIACNTCNIIKRDHFPLDEEDKPLLINPLLESYAEHIKQLDNGYLEGISQKGNATIETLKLNRPGLVEQRVLEVIEMALSNDEKLDQHEIYSTFTKSLDKVSQLNSIALNGDDSLKKYMSQMLYANVITALETYLCDRFINLIQGSNIHLRSFVEKFHDFKDEKFSLTEIFIKHDEIEVKAITALKGVLYHNLPKVSGMYRDTLGITFPTFSDVYKAVIIRHDIVHRSGKTKENKHHEIDSSAVEKILADAVDLVEKLELEISALD